MPIILSPYDRGEAVAYAHRWAYSRNPKYYDYEELGGDCTNFASQCLYAGGGVMNFTPDLGWYYIDANQKAPAWTGVSYLHQFLTRSNQSVGPAAVACALEDLMPGTSCNYPLRGSGSPTRRWWLPPTGPRTCPSPC